MRSDPVCGMKVGREGAAAEAEHAGSEEHDVERQRMQHQVGPEGVLDQECAHALENVRRG